MPVAKFVGLSSHSYSYTQAFTILTDFVAGYEAAELLKKLWKYSKLYMCPCTRLFTRLTVQFCCWI